MLKENGWNGWKNWTDVKVSDNWKNLNGLAAKSAIAAFLILVAFTVFDAIIYSKRSSKPLSAALNSLIFELNTDPLTKARRKSRFITILQIFNSLTMLFGGTLTGTRIHNYLSWTKVWEDNKEWKVCWVDN